jgi:hypothetical protein
MCYEILEKDRYPYYPLNDSFEGQDGVFRLQIDRKYPTIWFFYINSHLSHFKR